MFLIAFIPAPRRFALCAPEGRAQRARSVSNPCRHRALAEPAVPFSVFRQPSLPWSPAGRRPKQRPEARCAQPSPDRSRPLVEIAKCVRLCIPAKAEIGLVAQFADDDRALGASVLSDLPYRRFDGAPNDFDAMCWSGLSAWTSSNALGRAQQGYAASGSTPSSTAARVACRHHRRDPCVP